MRILLKMCLPILLALSLSSCASTTQYTETFSALSMTPDQRTVVVLGERYHYAFPAPDIMVASMQSDFRPHLAAAMPGKFHVSAGGKTFGLLRFQLTDDATAKDIAQAQALGYRASPEGLIYYTTELRGQRYVARAEAAAPAGSARADGSAGLDESAGAVGPASAARSNAAAPAHTTLRQTYRVEVMDSEAAQLTGQLFSPFIIAAGAGAAVAAPATLLIAVPVVGLKP